MIPISKEEERKVLSFDDSIFVGKSDYVARFKRGDKQVVYKADCEVLCLAEYFIDKYADTDYWVLVFKLEEYRYYSAVIKDNIVISEATSALIDIQHKHEYDLTESGRVISNFKFKHSTAEVKEVGGVDLSSIPKLYVTSLDEAYSKHKKKQILMALAAFGFLFFIVSWLSTEDVNKQVDKVQYIDPYSEYKADISNQIEGYNALKQAVNLYALSLTFPEEMELESISKQGNALELKLKNIPVRQAIVHQWLGKHPQMKPLFKGDKFLLDLATKESKWLKNIVPIGKYPEYLHDKAIEYQAQGVVLHESVINQNYEQRNLEAQFYNREIGALSLFSDFVKNTPTFLSSLRIAPINGKASVVDVTFSITIKGMINEE